MPRQTFANVKRFASEHEIEVKRTVSGYDVWRFGDRSIVAECRTLSEVEDEIMAFADIGFNPRK